MVARNDVTAVLLGESRSPLDPAPLTTTGAAAAEEDEDDSDTGVESEEVAGCRKERYEKK